MERRAHQKAKDKVRTLLEGLMALPQRRRYTHEDHAALLLLTCLDDDNSTESAAKDLKRLGMKRPSADLFHLYTKDLTWGQIERGFNRLNHQILDYAHRMGILPPSYDLALDSTRLHFWGNVEGKREGWSLGGDFRKDTRARRTAKAASEWALGGKNERGTDYAFEFLTLDAVVPGGSLTLEVGPLKAIDKGGQMTAFMASHLPIHAPRCKMLFLDRGFYSGEKLALLNRLGIRYIMPYRKPPKKEGSPWVMDKLASHYRSGNHIIPGVTVADVPVTLFLADNPRYNPERKAKRGDEDETSPFYTYVTNLPVEKAVNPFLGEDFYWYSRYGREWQALRPIERPRWLANRLQKEYSRRNQIESNYRVFKNEFRGTTKTGRGNHRLLMALTGILLRNLWVVANWFVQRHAAKEGKRGVPLTAKEWRESVKAGLAHAKRTRKEPEPLVTDEDMRRFLADALRLE